MARADQHHIAADLHRPDAGAGPVRPDRDLTGPPGELALAQRGGLTVAEPPVPAQVRRDTSGGAARRHILDKAVVVPVPPFEAGSIQQVRELRPESCESGLEIGRRYPRPGESAGGNRHDQVTQSSRYDLWR